MKKYFILLGCVSFLFFTSKTNAQTYSTGKEYIKADVNFMDVVKYEKTHPVDYTKKRFFEEEREDNPIVHPNRPMPDPSLVHSFLPEMPNSNPNPPALTVSPNPNDTFLCAISGGTNIPPDTHGVVDSQYVVTTTNQTVSIQTRTGTNVSSVSLDNFWNSLNTYSCTCGFTFDPRVYFDPYNRRWIMVTFAYGQDAHCQIMVAVSATVNPTGTWHMYAVRFDATGSTGNWLDFPNVGFNKKWIAVAGNIFPISSGSPGGATVYVFNYANIMAGTGAPYTRIDQSGAFSICPAITYNSTESNLYAVDIYNNATGMLRLWEISGSVGAPTMTAIGYPLNSTTSWSSTAYANSMTSYGNDFAPQAGSTQKIQTNDDRVNNCFMVNGKVWCSHTIFLPYSSFANPTRSSVMWWQMDTLGNPLQIGTVDDATNATFYAFPSLAVNKYDDALIGFSQFSTSAHPAAAYALHMHTDAAGVIRTPHVFRHGLLPYYQTLGGPKDRWGDYSATCVDPLNNIDFWTVQECVPSYSGGISNSIWDTWWAQIKTPVSAVKNITENEINVDIIPNPNTGNFELNLGQVINSSINVKIVDMEGKTVFEKNYTTAQNGTKLNVKTSGLANGIYMVNITTDNGTANKKIEINK